MKNVSLLPTPTAVGFSLFTALCLSVCFLHNVSTTDASTIAKHDIQMFHYESWKPIYFGVKITSHNKSVGLQTEGSIYAGCVRKPRWVFPAAMSHRTRHASDTGYSVRGRCRFRETLTTRDRQTTGFTVRVFLQSASGKSIAVVSQGTLVSAGFFSLQAVVFIVTATGIYSLEYMLRTLTAVSGSTQLPPSEGR